MFFPDYAACSLVNLMRSIGDVYAAPPTVYAPLMELPASQLRDYRTVILLVIDGLGDDYVQRHGALLKSHRQARLTSVFPSTTASSITAFLTGVAPQQHGLTGWFTYLKEIGAVTAVLPCQVRGSQEPLARRNIDIAALYNHTPFFDLLQVPSHVVSPSWIIDSDFNRSHSGRASVAGYDDLDGMLDYLAHLARAAVTQNYVYAYWPDFDRLSHQHGNGSEPVRTHFRSLESGIERLLRQIRGTNTLLLITADHGFIDTSPAQMINLNDHPRLQETLILPLSGEPRVAYCYVDPYKVEQFRNYLEDHFSTQLECVASNELLARGVFGLGEAHPRLLERIGHFTLLMKEHYIIKDWLVGERQFFNIGVHGGTSAAEMHVPLIAMSG